MTKTLRSNSNVPIRVIKPRKPSEAERRTEGRRAIEKLEKARGTPRTRFRRILALAKKMHSEDPESLHLLIAALGRIVQSQAIVEPILHDGDVDSRWMEEQTLLFDDTFPLDSAGHHLYDIVRKIKRTRRLRLGRDIVLPWPWRADRLQGAMIGLGSTGNWGPWKAELNHQVELWEPIRVGWVHGGNHSIAVGILLGRGTIAPQTTYDIAPLYQHVSCDGEVFRRKNDGAIISEVASVEFAAIFEIGRLLTAPSPTI